MDRCKFCFDGPKDIIHVLRDCFAARDLWLKVLPSTQLETFSQINADEWLRANLFAPAGLSSVSKEWSRKFAILCWLLWKNRCCRVIGSECMHREELLVRGSRMLEDCTRTFHGLRDSVMWGPLERWKCPPSGIAAVGRGQDLVVMDFEDPLVELLNLLEEEAASSC
ncbi:hypothetical protein V6N13_083585 [Hibiscus sabdariffa]